MAVTCYPALESRCLIAALQIHCGIPPSVLRGSTCLSALASAPPAFTKTDAYNRTELNRTMLVDRYLHPGSIAGALAFHRGRSNGRSAMT